MNYLAAYIDETNISWVIADMDSALVLEHGLIRITNIDSLSSDMSTNDNINEVYTLPTLPYSVATGFLSSDLASNLEIDLPFNDQKKVEKVIPLQIQDKLPFEIDNIHFVIKDNPSRIKESYRYFVSYIDKKRFESVLNACTKHGINFETICVETNFLDPLISALLKASEEEGLPVDKSVSIVSLGYLSEDTAINLNNNTNNELITKRDAIISITKNQQTFHSRKLVLPNQQNFLIPYLESHIKISLASSDHSIATQNTNYIIFCTESINQETESTFKSLPDVKIEKLAPDYSIGVTKIANPKLLFALFSAQSSIYLESTDKNHSSIFPNLRGGQFRYRAPFTEIKEAFLDQIAPFALVFMFGVLALVFKMLTPIKQNNLLSKKANSIATSELERTIKNGSELQELEGAISELELNLGNLSGVSNLSPTDWLYTLSNLIPQNLDIVIDSISVSTEGLSFRGTAKDYPSSGKLDSLLASLKNQNPSKFCETTLSTEQGSSSSGRKPFVGEISLCQ